MVEKRGWWTPRTLASGPCGWCVSKGSGGAAWQELQAFCHPANRDLVAAPVPEERRGAGVAPQSASFLGSAWKGAEL